MNGEEAARRWIDGWTRGWRGHDAEAIAALYSPEAVFLSHPFREALRGPEGARRPPAGWGD
jgi:ketosteroid isomerase-like protein